MRFNTGFNAIIVFNISRPKDLVNKKNVILTTTKNGIQVKNVHICKILLLKNMNFSLE